MNKANVIHAVEEAKRFQARAAALLKLTMPEGWTTYQGPESAAVRRSSMDLTKALAELRKPRQW
jgi:hypothetical protein